MHLMTDTARGTLKEDLLAEKILSAIVETKTSIDRVPKVLETIHAVAQRIDTVVAVGLSTRCDDAGEDEVLAPMLADLGVTTHRAKTNMGLGRITNVAPAEAAP